jgi:hypothetical protein
LRCFDIRTRTEIRTGLETQGRDLSIIGWFHGHLCVDPSTSHAPSLPVDSPIRYVEPLYSTLGSNYFEYEGKLAKLDSDEDLNLWITQYLGEKWINVRRLVIPPLDKDYVWRDDQASGCPTLVQEPSEETTNSRLNVFVAAHDGTYHLFLVDSQRFNACRRGFEFFDDSTAVSALCPENVTHEIVGWQPIDCEHPEELYDQLQIDREGLIAVATRSGYKAIRRDKNGICHLIETDYTAGPLISDSSDGICYKVAWQPSGELTAQRLESDHFGPPISIISDYGSIYLARWRNCLIALSIAWVAHAAVLIRGIRLIQQRSGAIPFSHRINRSMLAPNWRRAMATAIDMIVLFIVLVIAHRTSSTFCAEVIAQYPTKFDSLIRNVDRFETALCLGKMNWDQIQWFHMYAKFVIFPAPIVTGSLVAGTAIFFGLKIVMEGRYGFTPGKWLLGLRTVQATLQPCGIARAVVRNVLYYFDVPLFLFPIPAAISMMFSDANQRIGDRIAQTVVVKAVYANALLRA